MPNEKSIVEFIESMSASLSGNNSVENNVLEILKSNIICLSPKNDVINIVVEELDNISVAGAEENE